MPYGSLHISSFRLLQNNYANTEKPLGFFNTISRSPVGDSIFCGQYEDMVGSPLTPPLTPTTVLIDQISPSSTPAGTDNEHPAFVPQVWNVQLHLSHFVPPPPPYNYVYFMKLSDMFQSNSRINLANHGKLT